MKENWHNLSVEQIIEKLKTSINTGLSSAQAQKNLLEFGENKLPEKKKQSILVRFFKHFHDILIYVLFVAAAITLWMHHYADTIVILAVTVINAAIGFIQEGKAEKALADIKKLLSLKANVLRNSERIEIDADQLTIGDIVFLNAGDKIPADLRLVKTDNLKVEESILTGEAMPSEKHTNVLDEDTVLGDIENMAFSGTTVSAGFGIGVVVAVGCETQIGKISQMMSEVEPITTPLLKQTAQFGTMISLSIVAIGLIVFAFGFFLRDYDMTELIMSVIGLIVAAIPEGLPAILSIILAIGVQNMARQNAIIRNLPSVETLGSVSVICSDKTGTLTKNEMTVKALQTRESFYTVSGIGYEPVGNILKDNQKIDINEHKDISYLVNCFNTCNDSAVSKDGFNNWTVKGDPTEGALISLYNKSKVNTRAIKRISNIPFDSEYKYMATLIERAEQNMILIKGAPDKLLEMSELDFSEGESKKIDLEFWKSKISELAKEGQRVIGSAFKPVDSSVTKIDHEDIHDGIIFLGLAGIIDPPREEVIDAISACNNAQIKVKMITGDHVETAKAIGFEMGIGDGINAVQGKEIEHMSDFELREAVLKSDIFARTSPEHKLRLVKAIQSHGAICAMTGDGVNDALALKKADVGIAMGIKGTEVTKDASEMVLADDNFATIVGAIEEGRRIYDNLKKTILFILPTNAAGAILIIATILFGMAIPITPIQILWVNMVTSVTISFALAFEPVEEGAMNRPPRRPNEPLLNGYFLWRILFVGTLIAAFTLLVNIYLRSKGVDEFLVQTITVQTIVLAQMFHLFNNRSISGFAFAKGFFANKVVFIVSLIMIFLQLAFTYLPFMNNIFDTVPLTAYHWIFPISLGVLIFIIVEIEKFIHRLIKKA